MLLNVDLSNVEEMDIQSGPLPEGWYPVSFVASEMKQTKNGMGEYLSCEFLIREGKGANRHVWTNLNLRNPNEKAVEIAKRDLKKMLKAMGTDSLDTTMWANRTLDIYLKIRKSEQYGDSNNVTDFRPSQAAQVAQQFAQPQPAQQFAQPVAQQPVPPAIHDEIPFA